MKQGPSAGGAAANQEEEEEDLGLGGLSGKQLRELQDLVRSPSPTRDASFFFFVESLDDVPLCCCAEADRGGEHVGAVSAAVLPADGDAAVLHSHQGGREDPLRGRIGPDV